MKRLVWLLVLPCLVIAEDPFAAISGQMQAGMTFYGLQSPIYTPQGKQIAQVTSGKASMRNATSADVEHLLVSFITPRDVHYACIPLRLCYNLLRRVGSVPFELNRMRSC